MLTVTRISAGTSSNIIPETAELEGTIRALSEHTRLTLHGEVRRVCEHVAAAHGCAATVAIEHGYPVTVNDDEVTPQLIDLARSVLGVRNAEPMPDPLMGAEDFSYVLAKVPGAMAFLGACPPGRDPDSVPAHHSNRAVFDEAAMAHGVALYAGFALEALTPPDRTPPARAPPARTSRADRRLAALGGGCPAVAARPGIGELHRSCAPRPAVRFQLPRTLPVIRPDHSRRQGCRGAGGRGR